MTLEEAVRADMSKAIHDQLADIVNKAVRKGYDLAKAELIHCKDCKHWDRGRCEQNDYSKWDADDFCSWAEKEE